MSKHDKWGSETCKKLLSKTITLEMTVDMVVLSFGFPDIVDNKEITAKSENYRYVYGNPRQGATYVWFKNGKVVKIKQ